MNASLNKPQRPASNPERQFTELPEDYPITIAKDNEEDFFEPVLDIEDTDNIRKAVIYAEIINRKEYWFHIPVFLRTFISFKNSSKKNKN